MARAHRTQDLHPFHILCAVVWLCCACQRQAQSPLQQQEAHTQAMQAVQDSPQLGTEICGALQDVNAKGSCFQTAARLLANTDDTARAIEMCAAIVAGPHQDECHFQLAEQSKDISLCDMAGRFRQDCRMHQLTGILQQARKDKPDIRAFESEARERAEAADFDPEDPHVWTVVYRLALAGLPLNLTLCLDAPNATRAQQCRRAGLGLYQDRLNHARDRGVFPCDETPLPDLLAYTPDQEIDSLIESRKNTDLCLGGPTLKNLPQPQ